MQVKTVIFKQYCDAGLPEKGKHWDLETRELGDDLKSGEFLVKTLYLSVDPYLRMRMREKKNPKQSYPIPFPLGAPVISHGVGRVVKSQSASHQVNQVVVGIFEWSEAFITSEESAKKNSFTIVKEEPGLGLQLYCGGLGMPGLTAYVGLMDIGKPKAGETIFVSAASGAVGQMVGQLAKSRGLRVVGSAGSDEKVEYLKKELGFEAAFNYKKVSPLQGMQEFAPQGIDLYWDNVGGETLDAALIAANDKARFIECGMISGYNQSSSDSAVGVKNLMYVVSKQLLIQGFIVMSKAAEYAEQFHKEVSEAIRKNEFKYKEHMTKGLGSIMDTFNDMLSGKSFGKALVEVARE